MKNKSKGTKDYFDIELLKLEEIISNITKIVKNYNFNKIILPIFENLELFKNSIGDQTDIVTKEMFLLEKKGSESYVLRPEGTAPTVRFFIENKFSNNLKKQKYFYVDKMFRYERPQKGRMREFYQFGLEIFNDNTIYSELELLILSIEILNKLKIKKYKLLINSIGSIEDRNKYKDILIKYLEKNYNNLSDDSKKRFNKNPLRILDSKDKEDKKILINAPKIIDHISDFAKNKFEELKKYLKELNIDFFVDHNLVRGIDYYNDLVFEFISTDENKIGSNSAIIAGGRYDKLVNKIDNKKDNFAIGLAIGIERLLIISNDIYLNKYKNKKIVLTCFSNEVELNLEMLKISKKLRENIKIELDFASKNLNKKIENYLKNDYDYLLIVGKNEIKENKIILKDLKNKIQKTILINEIIKNV